MTALGREARPGRLLLTSRQDPNAARCSAFLVAGHHPVTSRSLPPEIPKPVRRQGRIDCRARDRAMTEPSLNRPGVVPLVGEGITAGVAKHVRVSLQLKAETPSSRPLDHPGKARGRERRATLADKDEG